MFLSTCRKSATWDRWLYFPSEVRRAEGVFALKNPTASAGCEPANLGTKGQHTTSRPPTPLQYLLLLSCFDRNRNIAKFTKSYHFQMLLKFFDWLPNYASVQTEGPTWPSQYAYFLNLYLRTIRSVDTSVCLGTWP